MIKEATATGRSVEEALEAACEQLGKTREEVEFEILDMPKRGFLGLSNTPAKVRVWMEYQQEAESAAGGDLSLDEKKSYAQEYIRNIIYAMGLDGVQLESASRDGCLLLSLSGDSAGISIGRRGETLDALQYLAGLAVNRMEGEYIRIILDSNSYRDRRRKTLEQLARKLADNALRTGRPTKLEPMNPFERRVIHSVISEIEGVNSSSVGEEPNRCIVISTCASRQGSDAADGGESARTGGRRRAQNTQIRQKREKTQGRQFDGAPRDRRAARREKPAAYKESGVREVPPDEAADKPLYGKIDL
jgi:spoIIIJ-associated protein